MKITLMANGLFHPKVWLLNIREHRLAFRKSSHMAQAALRRNKEQIALARSWMGAPQAQAEKRIR